MVQIERKFKLNFILSIRKDLEVPSQPLVLLMNWSNFTRWYKDRYLLERSGNLINQRHLATNKTPPDIQMIHPQMWLICYFFIEHRHYAQHVNIFYSDHLWANLHAVQWWPAKYIQPFATCSHTCRNTHINTCYAYLKKMNHIILNSDEIAIKIFQNILPEANVAIPISGYHDICDAALFTGSVFEKYILLFTKGCRPQRTQHICNWNHPTYMLRMESNLALLLPSCVLK